MNRPNTMTTAWALMKRQSGLLFPIFLRSGFITCMNSSLNRRRFPYLSFSIYKLFDFMFKKDVKQILREVEVSIQAGDIVCSIYDALLKQYKDPENPESLKSLNVLCVRIVFCLYAEDAGLFGSHTMFHNYLEQYPA